MGYYNTIFGRQWLLVIAFTLINAQGLWAQPNKDAAQITSFLRSYCIECHGADVQNADRRFDSLALPVSKTDTLIELKDVLDQVQLGEMPPDDSNQPTSAEELAFIELVTQTLAEGRLRLSGTQSGSVLRRLNRREYINTIGDLFAMNMTAFDPTTKFPRDQTEEHMDNLGDVLKTSGYLLDQYVEAADEVIEKVFALEKPLPEQTWQFNENFKTKSKKLRPIREYDNRYLNVYECMDSNNHEGSFGTIDNFKDGVPADGFYSVRVKAHAVHRNNPYAPDIFGIDARIPFRLGLVPGDMNAGPLELPQPIQPILAEQVIGDGEPQWHEMKVWLNAGQTVRFVFPNGPKDFRRSWFKVAEYHKDKWKGYPQSDRDRLAIGDAREVAVIHGKMPHIRIHEVEIQGPLAGSWPPRCQEIVLGKDPFDPKNSRVYLQRFASRAFRRPATQEEVDRLVEVARAYHHAGNAPFESLKTALKATLCSPNFLYLSQAVDPTPVTNKIAPRLNEFAIASRLSYFLWASMPDNELLQLANRGELRNPKVLLAQTRRMLASPRSNAFVEGFLDSWLNLRSLGGTPPDRSEFETYYSMGLEQAFKKETQLFMRDLIERDESIIHFLDCDYSMVNQAIATHYQLGEIGPPETSHEFRKVSFREANRGGLLGMGSVLTVSANGIETSPVVRGVFVLENILGTPPPPPPDDVPAIDPDVRGAKSVRELLSKHRDSPNCYSCHKKIDPLGFALENFDPVGVWRTKIGKTRIDAKGELPSGEKFENIAELKKVLVTRYQTVFARNLTERLLMYACGHRIGALDDPIVERIVAELPNQKFGLRSLIESVVLSEIFLSR